MSLALALVTRAVSVPLIFGRGNSGGRQHTVSLYGTASNVTCSAFLRLPVNPTPVTTTGFCKGDGRVGGTLSVMISIRTIRQTTQHTRHHQAKVAGIIRVAEGFPLDVFGTVEVVADVLDGRDVFHRGLIEELRTG